MATGFTVIVIATESSVTRLTIAPIACQRADSLTAITATTTERKLAGKERDGEACRLQSQNCITNTQQKIASAQAHWLLTAET